MMTETTKERCARAVQGASPIPPHFDVAKHIVEAVLDTLLEPTEAQYEAARYDWHNNHGPESRTLHGENIKGIWQAMIQAIKSGK